MTPTVRIIGMIMLAALLPAQLPAAAGAAADLTEKLVIYDTDDDQLIKSRKAMGLYWSADYSAAGELSRVASELRKLVEGFKHSAH